MSNVFFDRQTTARPLKTSLQDQISSYLTLEDYTTNDHSYGVARTAIVRSLDSSAFIKRVINLEEAVHGIGDAPRGSDPAQNQLNRINKLSADDLQIDYRLNSRNAQGETTFASIDSMKANYAANVSLDKLMDRLQAKYGVDYAPITNPAVTNNPAYQQLLALPQNRNSDAWTAQFQKVAGQVQALLDAVPATAAPSAGAASASTPTPAEQALATLQAAPSTTSDAAIGLATLQRASDAQRTQAAAAAQKAGGKNNVPASTAQKSSPRPTTPATETTQQTYAKGSIYNTTS